MGKFNIINIGRCVDTSNMVSSLFSKKGIKHTMRFARDAGELTKTIFELPAVIFIDAEEMGIEQTIQVLNQTQASYRIPAVVCLPKNNIGDIDKIVAAKPEGILVKPCLPQQVYALIYLLTERGKESTVGVGLEVYLDAEGRPSQKFETIMAQYNLTASEMTVALRVMQGMCNKEIADVLCKTVSSVEFHRKNIRKKLGINKKNINLTTHLLQLEQDGH